ncbi:MAG: hypothetical protein H7281_00975 [Bacteriovorax sp.]|nr:hypothetical protein [Bacteriovorax sp.]
MNKTITLLNFVLVSAFFLSSCTTQKIAEKKVENEIRIESVIKQSDVAENARDYILKSESLSELQKKSLLKLQDKTIVESKALSEEMNNAKLVLIKTILEPKVNEREVSILSKKIKKLGKKRMDLDYKSFLEARKIIDPLKEVRDREFLYNSFMMRHNYYW